ncbi:c-type cytochrome [Cupriavidus basilensis]|uniref:C-type cytochrome n=1 Tax=Cupriavidus basilensis TaxID=68895 RepID=A0ABT6AZX4_9BURK|nr:c-type cytochrome [Cupriavidus basilensis]MDF3838178.1 c-type cytochrome [Cupriavidus basilensis]
MNPIPTLAALAALALLALPCGVRAQAPDTTVLQARNWAAACFGCHGPAGRAPKGSVVPALAGRASTDLIRQMQEFKQGRREATVMQQIARGYSDRQIEAIAGWFATVR